MTEDPAVAVRDLRVVASRNGTTVPIVDRVDLVAEPTQVHGIVGETGAGKTLAMKATAGLLPRGLAGSGQLTLSGREPLDLASADAGREILGRSVCFILQNPAAAFDPLVRLEDQLTEGVLLHELMGRVEARARAMELLAGLGFRDAEAVLRLFPHQLSGGMSQRAAIAMSMMPHPTLLIADEPTSALDASVRLEVLRLLRELVSESGSALFLVTHDLSLVSRFCDQVTVMYAGRVMESGPTERVLSSPQHPYTRALLTCVPTLQANQRQRLEAIAGTPPQPGHWPQGCPFEPRCPDAVQRCRDERPRLRARAEHHAACHFAFEDDG